MMGNYLELWRELTGVLLGCEERAWRKMWHITFNIIDDAHWTLRVCMCVCAKHFLKVKCIFKNSFKWPTWILYCGSEPRSYWRKKPQACVDGPWRAESDWWHHLRPCAHSLDSVPILVVREILSRTLSLKSCPATAWACMTQLLSTCASPHGLWPIPPHPTPSLSISSFRRATESILENEEMPLQKNHHPLTGFSWASNLRTLNKTR